MNIISIANAKGGVAKTTTALSLAGSMVELGHKVLLIDLDPQIGLTNIIGLSTQDKKASILEAFFTNAPLNQLVIHTPLPGLDIIPGSQDMVKLEKSLSERIRYALKGFIKDAGFDYQTIIIDCPPFDGMLMFNALVATRLLIIPSVSEYLSLEALGSFIKRLESIRSRDNYALTYRILLTMYNPHNKVHSRMQELLSKNASHWLFDTFIPIDTKLSESQIHGMPITLFAPKSSSATAYRSVTNEVNAILEL